LEEEDGLGFSTLGQFSVSFAWDRLKNRRKVDDINMKKLNFMAGSFFSLLLAKI